MANFVSSFEKVSVPGNFRGLIEQYRCYVCTMRTHLFHLEWSRMQFGWIMGYFKAWRSSLCDRFCKEFHSCIPR